MATPRMYSLPPRPGFLGSFVGAQQVLIAAACCLAVWVLATQFLAWSFDYDAALGPARWGVYPPWKWISWCWRLKGSADPGILRAIKFAAIFGIVGTVVPVMCSTSSPIERAKRLSQGTDQIHGSATWATPEEVRATGLLSSTEGVYVGAWQDGDKTLYLRDNSDQHVLAFAPTRSGKGVGLVIPTLLGWSESAVIYDIKGENWAKSSGYRQSRGHICLRFAPVDENPCNTRFNPLAEVRLFTSRDVSDAQNIANMLVYTGHDAASDSHWLESAAAIEAGLILHLCYTAHRNGGTANLADLNRAFVAMETRGGEHIVRSFRQYLEEIMTAPQVHPFVVEKCLEMLTKEDREFSGVHSSAKTRLNVYSDPLVGLNTSTSDFEILDLVRFDIPISLYLVVPPSDKIRLRPLIRLIFTMIVNRLTEKTFEGAEQQKNRHQLGLIIDEFPSLKYMEIFADALSYMASYGLKAYLIAQDIRQIVDAYGPNESIVSNCGIRVAFAPNQLDTAEMLSQMLGQATIERASYNFSGQRRGMSLSNMSASVDLVKRPLLTADEVSRLPADASIIFTTGNRPIYGKKIRYYLDPVFAEQAAIPPPQELVRIVPDDQRPAPAPVVESEPVPAGDWPV
jgi:type IV secretion system protein VirD4